MADDSSATPSALPPNHSRQNSSNNGSILFAGRPNPNIFLTGGYSTLNQSSSISNHHDSSDNNIINSDPISAHNSNIHVQNLHQQCLTSTELIFSNKTTWLLIFGPLALMGKSGLLGESTCFVLAGLALIPLAERLSFVTEEVARHTNQTIGALLNATFGNAPELLISSAALKEGFYRVVQLTLLGSILTNLLFVFGLSCLIGGLRFQVQELRMPSGNASIGMLMLAVAGLALPAALELSSEMVTNEKEPEYVDKNGDGISDHNDGPSLAMVGFSRFNAAIMVSAYVMYLLFQLGTHKEEFEDLEEDDKEKLGDDVENQVSSFQQQQHDSRVKSKVKVRKNKFCRRLLMGYIGDHRDEEDIDSAVGYERVMPLSSNQSLAEIEMSSGIGVKQDEPQLIDSDCQSLPAYLREKPSMGNHSALPQSSSDIGRTRGLQKKSTNNDNDEDTVHMSNVSSRRRTGRSPSVDGVDYAQSSLLSTGLRPSPISEKRKSVSGKSHCSDGSEEEPYAIIQYASGGIEDVEEPHMSFKAGLVWLFVITICISAMSGILVDTIDGFAYRYGISEVFTSLVILPYFSNIAEQVSAVIFAYRNEMDLCIGITVGSAVQIALFVLPGSVLIGWAMDRSMSLFFRGFETCCLIFAVTSVAAVMQGGTTTYLTGGYLLGVYFMIAAGFWFHEQENLSIDGELTNEITNLHNHSSF